MEERIAHLKAEKNVFTVSKADILNQWISYASVKEILILHKINEKDFIEKYASGVFDYFMGVIAGSRDIGDCPVMQEFLAYLKFREISADELFEICSNFRRSMIEFTYDAKVNSKEIFEDISYIFDKNFKGILKYYTDSIFQKLIDARQEALRAAQAKEYFLSNMSHEIRTPLNAILGFVNLLMDEDISNKHRNYLDIILNSGENLLSIINDILDFSKLRSGEFNIEAKVFSLHEELSHTMELFVASANSKDITITSFIDPRIPKELFGDVLRIKQIVSNFLSNAIKFTPVGGVIKVEASCHNQQLTISVNDNGVGINKEDLQNIFVAFTQARSSEHDNKEGSGLGLCISHQLAELMHGKVHVNSKVGEGSTFWLDIPVEVQNDECQIFNDISDFQKLKMVVYAKDKVLDFRHESFIKYAEIFTMDISVVDTLDCEFDICIFVHEKCSVQMKKEIINSEKKYIALMSREYDTYEQYNHIHAMCFPLYCSKIHRIFNELLNPELSLTHDKKISNKFKGHILVAEDNEANQELIKIILSKYGLTFDLAVNGQEAVALYKRNTYDLILMDEQMPVMNGTDAVAKIIKYEEAEGLSHTPISALTANVLKGNKEKDLLNGFDTFLGKPLVLKELERVFIAYLKLDSYSVTYEDKTDVSLINKKEIIGLDSKKLMKELMLNENELIMLLTLFIKKMKSTMTDLAQAIKVRDYKKIALLSHNIKGSSGNFRIELLQKNANEIEKRAKLENVDYPYEKTFQEIEKKIASIKVN
ncbi:hybrid sensor histidine kinase/response regulator [Sulfurimonas autotrophica]|uniref:histidine kinase n=1 Tax=Sulfurimonas autotrophica (strain ATCC BAA-671 / DSM 16294 / JCM 11897 / OK10) TaxID=563040 RepID=E0UUT3_SULAO|nr:hybrid sensor histidine kinase/response regulator [Sulfurimonas autotrophica]ADN09587.1 Hpt sensor hybrid histidine kinase [Sulfurimonas autotrophica DSM 16294]